MMHSIANSAPALKPKGPSNNYAAPQSFPAAGAANVTAMDSHVNSLGTLRSSDLKEKMNPLHLASSFVDSYLEKDERYPEIGQMALRMFGLTLISSLELIVFREFMVAVPLLRLCCISWTFHAIFKN